MKKINTALICASTALFANSTSAGWSVGGFIGQSSINGCRPISIAPVSTLTTNTFDEAAFDEAFSVLTSPITFEDNFLSEEIGSGDSLVFDFTPFPTLDSEAVNELFSRIGDFITVTQDSFIGTSSALEASIDATNETSSTISASFTNLTPAFETVNLGTFDATDIGTFIVGATPVGAGGIIASDIIVTEDGFIQSFQPTDDNITQSLETTNAFFECDVDDDNDIGFGLNIAYNFTKNWGIEAGYVDLGDFSATSSPQNIEVLNPQTIDINASAFYLAGTATYYYSNKWSITGRLGAYQIDVDSRFSSDSFSLLVGNGISITEFTFSETSVSSSFEDEDVYFGTSLNYDLNDKFQVQLRYDNFDIDLISLGLRYNL